MFLKRFFLNLHQTESSNLGQCASYSSYSCFVWLLFTSRKHLRNLAGEERQIFAQQTQKKRREWLYWVSLYILSLEEDDTKNMTGAQKVFPWSAISFVRRMPFLAFPFLALPCLACLLISRVFAHLFFLFPLVPSFLLALSRLHLMLFLAWFLDCSLRFCVFNLCASLARVLSTRQMKLPSNLSIDLIYVRPSTHLFRRSLLAITMRSLNDCCLIISRVAKGEGNRMA